MSRLISVVLGLVAAAVVLTLSRGAGERPASGGDIQSPAVTAASPASRPPAPRSPGGAVVLLGQRPSGPAVALAVRQLAALQITSSSVPRPYRRDEFGEAWRDLDDNGCNQRDDVLVRDAVPPGSVKVGQQGRCDHDVLAGEWVDPYSGQTIRLADAKDPQQSQLVQIDHLVPLEAVWESGGWKWSRDRREAYANALSVLTAVGGHANMSKGSRDPSQWLPARREVRCSYALAWVRIKSTWHLSVTAPEREALTMLLRSCSTKPAK